MQMGKAGRWLRSFLTGRKDKKGRDEGEADSHSFPSTGQVSALPTPSAKEKRRWSFRRPAAVSGKDTSTSGQGQLASTSSHCFSEVLAAVQDQHAVAVPDAAGTAGTASKGSAVGDAEEAAAVRIQSAFRSYLARKALCALRGMVKLQAIVRGQLVRRQANMTLRCIQALVAAQRRARAERLRLIDDGKTLARTPRPRTSRRSPQHHRASRKPLVSANDHGMLRAAGLEENVRIVEVDDGGGEARGARRSSCCSTPVRAELYQKASPTPSGLMTDGSARTFSGRFEEHSASFSAASEASGRHHRNADQHVAAALLFPRNYMANTESSRAKARSQSAPRHRPASAGGSEAVPSSPSCERPPSVGGGVRRRASIDPRDLDGARAGPSRNRSSDATRMERCASQARAGAGAGSACQSAVRLDGHPSVSLPGSECGSSSSAVVASAAAGARMA